MSGKSKAGCPLAHLPYEEQLSFKEDELRRVFGRDVVVHPSPLRSGYRGKVEFVVTPKAMGFRRPGDALSVVDVKESLLLSDNANDVWGKVRESLEGVEGYDLSSHKGFLRYVTVREVSSGEVMVAFTTTSPSEVQDEAFRKVLERVSGFVASAYWLVHDGKADVASGEVRACVGKPYLIESVCGKDFLIGPLTFFQSNVSVAGEVFSRIREVVAGKVLDLFCGVGAISLCVADVAESVVGVESFKPSVDAAVENASLNGVSDVSFVAVSGHEYVKKAIINRESFDTVVVDPPRTGLGPVLSRALARLKPGRIVYMSCNPRSLRDDLASLRGYRLASLEGWDMFPQTSHVECLAVLERE